MPTNRFINLNKNKKTIIEHAIIKEMMRHPFEHINISNIVSSAAISRGSFYQYFQNKHDFYFYILTIIANTKRSYIDFNYLEDSSQSFIHKIKHILEASILFSKDNTQYVEIGLQMYASTHQDIKNYFETAHQDMTNLLMKWLTLDPTYQNIKNKDIVVEYMSTSMIYLTQYALKFNSIHQLESYFILFVKMLEGGLHNV